MNVVFLSTMTESAAEFLAGFHEAIEQDAAGKIETMSPEECQEFVREFCSVILEWQPQIPGLLEEDEAMSTAIGCMMIAKLFPLAFNEAYVHTDKMVSASNALKKALGQ